MCGSSHARLISGSGDISTMNEPSVADNNREEFSNDIVSSSSPRQLDISDIDALSDMIDDNNTSSSTSWCQTHCCNPLNTLSFIKRRTIQHYHNLSLSELSGSLGDLGTFIPLTVALARERKVS